MLESFGFFRSASASDGKRSGQNQAYEERQSLLLSTANSDVDAAEATTTTHRRVPSASTSGDSTASASNNTTGMNPQDDLEQAPTGDSVDEIVPISAVNDNSIADPLLSTVAAAAATSASSLIPTEEEPQSLIQERGRGKSTIITRRKSGRRRRKRRTRSSSSHSEKTNKSSTPSGPLDALCTMCLRALCLDRTMLRNSYGCMNVIAKLVVWTSVLALAAVVVWYSYEFAKNGTDPHLIAWFSAGAFVLLGFPLSMGSIVAHLANYNQPHVQCYIVRILWMVPMYSMESWLCLRFHEYAIYIETLRDCYESFVLYSFLQFLIEVLGGEEALILMLKDKSPTRGSHMWGLQWCVKPWLMGQPVRRSDDEYDNDKTASPTPHQRHQKSLKRVHWKSPFFIQCKFGVLQYVLLKFVCSFLAMILEMNGVYKEGNFTPKGGYLYICFITNLSQCWALYCLILFYYATHNELGPIRPVGKFLSVKALVFFTWWQSVAISMLYQMDMIPHYNDSKTTINLSPEDVAKGLQDYLICIEMFFAAIVHTIVFPHTEYSPQEVEARARALNQSGTNPNLWQQRKRLGRHHQYHSTQLLRNYQYNRDDKSANSDGKSAYTQGDRSFFDLEMTTLSSGGAGGGAGTVSWEEPATTDGNGNIVILPISANRIRSLSADSINSDLSPLISPSTVGGSHDWSAQAGDPSPEWDALAGRSSSFDSNNGRTHQPLSDSLTAHHHGQPPPSLMQPTLNDRQSTIDEGVEEDHCVDSADDEDGDYEDDPSGSEFSSEGEVDEATLTPEVISRPNVKQNFVQAFIDSAIPRDLRDNTVGIVKGDYVVEKKTLLHHATTSDHYDLFSQARRATFRTKDGSVASGSRSRWERPDKKS